MTTPLQMDINKQSLIEAVPQSVTNDTIILSFPGTQYQSKFTLTGKHAPCAGIRVCGRIHVMPQRIDIARAGGCFIEPCYGRPRRIQGRIIGINLQEKKLIIRAGFVVSATLHHTQPIDLFEIGQLVMFDTLPHATFEQVNDE